MNDLIDLSKGEIKIFSENGANQVEVILQDDSIWLSAEKIGQLFDNKDRSTIQRHIKNIYADDELEESSTCAFFAQVQKEGTRTVSRKIPYYNLDVILAVGYRVSSKIATQFRKWATSVLHQYIIDGYVINEKQIKQEHQKLVALQTMTASLAENLNSEKLENFTDIKKAAMLLYSITKDHCFHDGNKRIAASCFLYFMQKNNMLYVNGKKRIDDNTLFAITLFIAESKAEDMEMFRQIIISILNRNLK